jgi:hypothetical protein
MENAVETETCYTLTTFLSIGTRQEMMKNYEDLRYRLAVMIMPLNLPGKYEDNLRKWKPDFDLKAHLQKNRVWNGLSGYGTPILIEAV